MPETEGEVEEGAVNLVDPIQAPQEPEANPEQEGKPRSMTHCSKFYAT